jgi:hypothetical protein
MQDWKNPTESSHGLHGGHGGMLARQLMICCWLLDLLNARGASERQARVSFTIYFKSKWQQLQTLEYAFGHSVPTVSTVRALSSIRHKAVLNGLVRAGFENPKESSHGDHGGHGGLRFAVWGSEFGVLSSASALVREICGSGRLDQQDSKSKGSIARRPRWARSVLNR